MANLTQVLYGSRLYGKVTYEENYDPQTLTANLSDTQSSADADIISGYKVLSDSQTPTDALVKAVTKVLSDTQASTDAKVGSLLKILTDAQGASDVVVLALNKFLSDLVSEADALTKLVGKPFNEITTSSPNLFGAGLFGAHTYSSDMVDPAIYLRDAIARVILKAFSDSLLVNDASVAIRQTKGFLDFLLVKEWVNFKLIRASAWTAQAANIPIGPSTFSLFGRPLFGKSLFTATPILVWGKKQDDSTIWTDSAAPVPSIQTLYAKTLFGQSLFSDKPVIFWVVPAAQTESWTNSDGQNNQEA